MIFGENVIENKMCDLISLKLRSDTLPHYKKNSARYYQKCTYVFMWSTRYSCQILMKLEISRQVFEKYSNTKFHENQPSRSLIFHKISSGGIRVVPCGRTDRHNEANSRFSQFYERAYKCNKNISVFRKVRVSKTARHNVITPTVKWQHVFGQAYHRSRYVPHWWWREKVSLYEGTFVPNYTVSHIRWQFLYSSSRNSNLEKYLSTSSTYVYWQE
jgi:hypothetical protein